MKKTLITTKNVENYIEGEVLYVKKDMIISPGVFDDLRKLDIEVIYSGEEEVENTCVVEENTCIKEEKKMETEEEVRREIQRTLKEDYGLVDKSIISKVESNLMNIILK